MVESARDMFLPLADDIVRVISEQACTRAIPTDHIRMGNPPDLLSLIRITQQGREMCRLLRRHEN